jgi:hypothetical protein
MHPYRRKNIAAKGNLFQEREGILKAMIIYWIYKIDVEIRKRDSFGILKSVNDISKGQGKSNQGLGTQIDQPYVRL